MKHNIAGFCLLLVFAFAFWACENENDFSAPLTRFEIDGLTATAGDESVTLQWVPQAGKPTPESYFITWSSSGSTDGNGEYEVDGNTTSYIIEGLKNDVLYNIAVQSRYPDGLARKVTATATPKTARIPVSEFKATAGDKCVYLSWAVPETPLNYAYEISVSENGNEVKVLNGQQGISSMLVSDLTNDVEYSFAITVIYSYGKSVTLTASAIPGQISPISCMPESPHPFEICKLEYNPAFFVSGTIASVEWSVDGMPVSNNDVLTYMFPRAGESEVSIKATFTNGETMTGSIKVNVQNFAWIELPGAGYQKASNFAFSPDGQTLYSISQSSKMLLAVNAITGEIKWQQSMAAATYGAGVAIGSDGKVYLGTEDKDGTIYAFTPNGTLRWSTTMGAAIKASPAVTTDGKIYVLCDGATLKCFNADNGKEIWSASLSGNAGGVAVDANGNVYAGTSSGIWAYNSNGTRLWMSADAHKVTERGGSLAIDSKNGTIYAALKAKSGIAAVNMTDGTTRWTYASEYNDCYHPVIDENGTVYFCEKNGALYAVNSNGSLKWKHDSNLGYTYSGFAIGENGHAYITQYASPFVVLDIDQNGSANVIGNIAQTMSPVLIGPDARLYYGLNGTIATMNIGINLAKTGWPCRGFNQQGTNSLK